MSLDTRKYVDFVGMSAWREYVLLLNIILRLHIRCRSHGYEGLEYIQIFSISIDTKLGVLLQQWIVGFFYLRRSKIYET